MKKIIVFLLTFILSFMVPATTYANTLDKNDENVKAKSAILMCLDTGDVLFAKNEYEHVSPASVTKILALLIILEHIESGKISLTDKVTASKNAVAMGGSQIWLEEGEQMTVEELLKSVIVASANDGCTALGEYVAGSSVGFVKMMNDKAKKLGLEHTNFENCTGLDDTVKNHYSCAYDLAVITREVMKYPIVQKYTTIWLDYLRNGETELNNTNKLVNTYNGITGLKTGTTSNAGFCISATASRDNMNLVAVILGSDTSQDRFDSATYLLDWGFANFQVITPEIDKSKITPVKVLNGEEKSITPEFSNSAKLLTEKGDTKLEYEYKIKEKVASPIQKGDALGEIIVKNNGNQVATIKLTSPKFIRKLTFSSILKIILSNI